jgi:hypothetical protein
MAKKIHFSSSDQHDQPACKVVPDTTKILLTKSMDEVTCLGCQNRVVQHPHLISEREREKAKTNER